MKILQVIPYFCFGGAETMCRDLTLALLDRGHTVTVVSLYDEHTPIAQALEERGVPVRYLDKHLGLDVSMVPKLAKILKEERPDAVHTHLDVIKYTVAAARLAGISNCVHTVHNVADQEAEGRLQRCVNGFYFRHGWSTPVALSRRVRETVAQFYRLPEERVPVVFNGVDLSRYRPKESYALGEKPTLLHIGRFNHQKNHAGLLQAFALLRRRFPQARLRLLGEGELLEDTRALAGALGISDNVEFLGVQRDVAPYLFDADIFTLPSHFEGMPMTLIEAMAAGVPIVAAPVGGVPDMLTDGESALLVPPDPEKTAAAWTRLIEDEALRTRLGRGALQSSRRFSAREMAAGYEELYGG